MKTKNIFLTIALVLCTTFTFAQGTIVGSAHDMSTLLWNSGTDQVCITCHTPHNSNGAAGAPLWNHASTATVFGLYTSTTLTAVVGQPTGTSKLCLSCHDGTVDLVAYGATTDTGLGTSITALLGTNLATHHPVSFPYTTALATTDTGLFDPATKTTVADLLFSTNLECASCHDVHNNGPAAAGKLLRVVNTGSALCLTCHNK